VRKRYLYRLNVDYNGLPAPPIEQDVRVPDDLYYAWPVARVYQSWTAALRRATLLRSLGATVTIERSKPVEWEDS